MTKLTTIFIFTLVFLTSCTNPSSKENDGNQTSKIHKDFDNMINDYYEEGLKLNPINATFVGDNRYNNRFPNFLSGDYREKLKIYYSTYLEKQAQFSDEDLTENEQ